MAASTVSNLNEKAFEAVEVWRNRPLERAYPYACVDGIYLKHNLGGSYENVAVMVAIGADNDGHREVIGTAEGFTESSECWQELLAWLKSRSLRGVRMLTGDKAAGMVGPATGTNELAVAGELESMRLGEPAKVVRSGHAETLTHTPFPRVHWRRIRTNNTIERLDREIRRRTRAVGTFPDGNSTLMLVTARPKYVAESEWGSHRYLDVMLPGE